MAISVLGSGLSYTFDTSSTSSTDQSKQVFKQLDSDGDGAISSEEFASFNQLMNAAGGMAPPPPPQMEDSGESSSVSGMSGIARGTNSTSDINSTLSTSLFSSADADSSGSLSLDEFSALLAQSDTQAATGERMPPPPPPPPAGGTSSNNGSATTDTSVSNSTDASSDDVESTMSSLFAKVDSNGDGVLSTDEFSSLITQLRTSFRNSTG